MTLLTIEEAAVFLRLKKRTLYLRKDIPRIREGHRVLYLQEDLEAWVLSHREKPDTHEAEEKPDSPGAEEKPAAPEVDRPRRTVYHRTPALRAVRS